MTGNCWLHDICMSAANKTIHEGEDFPRHSSGYSPVLEVI